MSIEVTLHPRCLTNADCKRFWWSSDLNAVAICGAGRNARLHFRWFSDIEYQSYDGVEATIFVPTEGLDEVPGLVPGRCTHGRVLRQALPTKNSRTASSVPRENVSAVRSTTTVQARTDTRRLRTTGAMPPAAVSTGPTNPCASRSAPSSTPCPIRRLTWNALSGPISNLSPRWTPRRVLYNALVPFTLAAVEHFLSRSFKVLLEFDPNARERLQRQTRRVDMSEVLSIAEGRHRSRMSSSGGTVSELGRHPESL